MYTLIAVYSYISPNKMQSYGNYMFNSVTKNLSVDDYMELLKSIRAKHNNKTPIVLLNIIELRGESEIDE